MAQGFLHKTKLLHGTILLCVPLFLSLPAADATALPESSANSPAAQPYQGNMNAYRARRIRARAESYEQRKQFPPVEAKAAETPPAMVENKDYEPLRVTIPNLVQADADRREVPVVTRSSNTPAYKQLAATRNNNAVASQGEEPAPLSHQLAEAGSAVTNTISSAGRSLLSAVIPSSLYDNKAAPEVQLPQVEIAAAEETRPPQQTVQEQPVPVPAKAPATTAPQPEEKPSRYFSPGIVIKREVVRIPADPEALASATPEQLARLAPAAGEPAAGVDAPLIQIPSSEQVPAEPVPPPTIKPLVAPAAPVEAPPAPISAEPVVVPPPPKAEDIEKIKEIIQALPADDQSLPAKTLPALEPAKTEPASVPAKQEAAQPAVSSSPPVTAVEETPENLSPKSKQILQKLPAMADEKIPEPKGLDIDRGKETSTLFEADVQEQSSEASGVKIEVKAPSMNIDYELEKAYNALLSGQNTAAIEIYKAVLINDPVNEDALFGLATTYHRAGQIEAARPLYGRLLAKNPTHRAALNNFLVLVADESPQEALMQLEALEQKSPDFSPIPAQMAVIYQKIGDFAKASEKMFKAVSLAPENLTYRYNLAILMDKQRNFDEAIKLYSQIIQAHARGEVTPGNINKIQERLTFLRSNKP